MIRAAELSLFLAPIVVYVLWRRAASRGGLAPSRYALIVLLAALIVMGAGLAWSGLKDRHPENSQYVPAQLENGRVVPGHGA